MSSTMAICVAFATLGALAIKLGMSAGIVSDSPKKMISNGHGWALAAAVILGAIVAGVLISSQGPRHSGHWACCDSNGEYVWVSR